MNKFNDLGYLNKSKSYNFISLLLNNIFIEDYNQQQKINIDEPIIDNIHKMLGV